jgi:hypothetical protein
VQEDHLSEKSPVFLPLYKLKAFSYLVLRALPPT